MTYSLSVSGSRAEAPYHPFTAEEAAAFDHAATEFADSLKAAGLKGTLNGSRPGTQAEYEERPRVGDDQLDTSNKSISITF